MLPHEARLCYLCSCPCLESLFQIANKLVAIAVQAILLNVLEGQICKRYVVDSHH